MFSLPGLEAFDDELTAAELEETTLLCELEIELTEVELTEGELTEDELTEGELTLELESPSFSSEPQAESIKTASMPPKIRWPDTNAVQLVLFLGLCPLNWLVFIPNSP